MTRQLDKRVAALEDHGLVMVRNACKLLLDTLQAAVPPRTFERVLEILCAPAAAVPVPPAVLFIERMTVEMMDARARLRAAAGHGGLAPDVVVRLDACVLRFAAGHGIPLPAAATAGDGVHHE